MRGPRPPCYSPAKQVKIQVLRKRLGGTTSPQKKIRFSEVPKRKPLFFILVWKLNLLTFHFADRRACCHDQWRHSMEKAFPKHIFPELKRHSLFFLQFCNFSEKGILTDDLTLPGEKGGDHQKKYMGVARSDYFFLQYYTLFTNIHNILQNSSPAEVHGSYEARVHIV